MDFQRSGRGKPGQAEVDALTLSAQLGDVRKDELGEVGIAGPHHLREGRARLHPAPGQLQRQLALDDEGARPPPCTAMCKTACPGSRARLMRSPAFPMTTGWHGARPRRESFRQWKRGDAGTDARFTTTATIAAPAPSVAHEVPVVAAQRARSAIRALWSCAAGEVARLEAEVALGAPWLLGRRWMPASSFGGAAEWITSPWAFYP